MGKYSWSDRCYLRTKMKTVSPPIWSAMMQDCALYVLPAVVLPILWNVTVEVYPLLLDSLWAATQALELLNIFGSMSDVGQNKLLTFNRELPAVF